MNYNKLFVGGDLSGIQKFLYNITSRKAAISLKGRSEYLSLYLREVCNKLQDEISEAGDNQCDELYCSGGKFYLITQNTEAIVQAIEKRKNEETTALWKEHKGLLSINISYVAFAEIDKKFYVEGHEDEQNTTSGVLWKYVNAEFARQKNQKFKNLLIDTYADFFEAQKVGGKPKVCAISGIESDDCIPIESKDKEEANLVFLPSVIKQIELGRKLNKEQQDGIVKTFEDYADGSYLGILRMDVDGLGKRFIVGFETIDRYKAFSDKVKNFFEKNIGGRDRSHGDKLLNEKDPATGDPYHKYLNVIYAGGDDLFIIGRWDKLINFAALIHDKTVEHFRNDSYKDENGKDCFISISGGIAIVKPKFPIAKAAELAGEAEDNAKHIEGKNAFNMFGKTIKWGKEFDYVKDYKEKFVTFIQDKEVEFGKSILHKLMLYSFIADTNKVKEQDGQKPDFSYMWNASYYLTRFMDKYKSHENEEKTNKKKKERLDFCRNLRDKQLGIDCNGRNLELIAVAARWAELELKIGVEYL